MVATLEREGIEKFVASVNELLKGIAHKRHELDRSLDATLIAGPRRGIGRRQLPQWRTYWRTGWKSPA